jgi:hypothetical protein
MFRCKCPSCGQSYQVPDPWVGNQLSCPQCHYAINVPRPIPPPPQSGLPQPQAPHAAPQIGEDNETVLERRIAPAMQIAHESCRRLEDIWHHCRIIAWPLILWSIISLVGALYWITEVSKHARW